MKTEVISLTRKQLVRLDIINKANAGFITIAEGASSLGISERQFKRLKKKVKENGEAALIHKNQFRKPAHAIPDEICSKIVALKKSRIYLKANFLHFRELLEKHHDIYISYTALFEILSSAGVKSPKTRRRFKPHRRRKRKPQAGLLLQVDATPFAWFGGKSKYSIHGAIDDATSQVTALYICKNECLQGYFEMFRSTLENFGVPVSLYADRHNIFRSPNADKLSVEDQLNGVTAKDTQFGRALSELNVTIIPARSPQAKGRIERLWGTLQSRLPIEFAIRKITTIDAANEFLSKYIFEFNQQFAVDPENYDSAFMPLPKGINLDYILCIKDQRSIDRGGVFSYYNKNFKIIESAYSNLIPPNAKIQVFVSPWFGIKVMYKKFIFDTIRFAKPKKVSEQAKPKAYEHQPQSTSQCWKYDQSLNAKVPFDESYNEMLNMLENIFLSKNA